jgi:hypothetical protein
MFIGVQRRAKSSYKTLISSGLRSPLLMGVQPRILDNQLDKLLERREWRSGFGTQAWKVEPRVRS